MCLVSITMIKGRVALRLSDLRAQQTPYRTKHLKWFFTKKVFWQMSHNLAIRIHNFKKQSNKSDRFINRFQKFLCKVDRHEECDFSLKWLFWVRSFFGHFFKISWIKKWPEPKKSFKWKISFFMPVNLAKKFLKFIHTVVWYSWLLSEPSVSHC